MQFDKKKRNGIDLVFLPFKGKRRKTEWSDHLKEGRRTFAGQKKTENTLLLFPRYSPEKKKPYS